MDLFTFKYAAILFQMSYQPYYYISGSLKHLVSSFVCLWITHHHVLAVYLRTFKGKNSSLYYAYFYYLFDPNLHSLADHWRHVYFDERLHHHDDHG